MLPVPLSPATTTKRSESLGFLEQIARRRLQRTGDFEFVIWDDDTILNKPVEEWPVVDALVAFFSDGYPLPKAKAYVDLRKPYLLNDVDWQARGEGGRAAAAAAHA